jgi:hypothetical protein
MSLVKVTNLHDKEYVEMFRDEEIRIPPGGFVEMGRSEAKQFLGQVTPLNVDGSGRCIKPKKLKIVEDPETFAAARDQPLRFTAPDGNQFRTQEGHDNYMMKLREEATKTTTEGTTDGPRRRRKAQGAEQS